MEFEKQPTQCNMNECDDCLVVVVAQEPAKNYDKNDAFLAFLAATLYAMQHFRILRKW